MKREDVFVLFKDKYDEATINKAFTALGKNKPGYDVGSTDLPDRVIADLQEILEKTPKAIAGKPSKKGSLTRKQNDKPVANDDSAVPQTINLGVDAESYGRLVEVFKKQGVTQAEALVAISQDAFLQTLSNSSNQFNDDLIQSLITNIIQLKMLQQNSASVANVPVQTAANIQDLAIAAQTEANGFDWQEIADTAESENINWDSILGC